MLVHRQKIFCFYIKLKKLKKAVKIYAVIVIAFVLVGSTLKVDLVWNLSDMFNGLMVLPNLIALLPCIGIVVKKTMEYENK